MYLIWVEQLSASMGWCDGAKQFSLDNLHAQVRWSSSIQPSWCFDFSITIWFQGVASVSPLHTLSIGRGNHPQEVMWGPVLFENINFGEHQCAKWQNTYENGLGLCVSRRSVEQQSNNIESSLTIPPARTPWTASNTLWVTINPRTPRSQPGRSRGCPLPLDDDWYSQP